MPKYVYNIIILLAKCCKIQQIIISTKIFIQLQQKYLFNFNKNNFIQQKYLFNFNQQKFHSTTIFVQLQPKLFSFNKNVYSTSTKNNFIQQQSSRTFKISSFNKIPRPSPVKYKTALSHASNISKTLSNTQLRDEQITFSCYPVP